MAINNYFNATPVSIDFNAVKQVDSKPAASGFADGNIIFDKTEQQFYQALSGSWIALDFIGDDFTVNKLAFNTAATETLSTGELAWNADDETVDMHVGDDVTIQLGQEMVYHVINQTGSQIDNGTVVMADGALGASGKIKVVPAIADGSVPAKYIMGVATEDIPNGALGYATAFGKVRGFDTSSYSSGTVLYASATSSGSFTDTAPSLPNQKVTVAITLDQKSNGNIFVRPTYDDRRKSVSSISDLENVNTSENDVVYLDSGGRSGWFKWNGNDNLSTEVSNDTGQGIYVAPSGEDGSNGAWVRDFDGYYNALWWGVTKDRATNSTTEMQAAIDFVNATNGGVIHIPAGEYQFSVNISSKVNIWGAGNSRYQNNDNFSVTLIRPVDTSTPIFTTTGAYIELRDMDLIGADESTGTLIDLGAGISHFLAQDIKCFRASIGINGNDSNPPGNVLLINSTFRNLNRGAQYFRDSLIDGCVFSANNNDAIRLNQGQNRIVNNFFEFNRNTGVNATRNGFTGPDESHAIILGPNANEIIISGNQFDRNSGHDITTDNNFSGNYIQIINNLFKGSAWSPGFSNSDVASVNIKGTGSDITIVGNTFERRSYAPSSITGPTTPYRAMLVSGSKLVIRANNYLNLLEPINFRGWAASSGGTGEYYAYDSTADHSLILNEPNDVLLDGSNLSAGTVGSLSVGEWDWADNDSLGYNTVYVRISGDANPTGEDIGFTYNNIIVSSNGIQENDYLDSRRYSSIGANSSVSGTLLTNYFLPDFDLKSYRLIVEVRNGTNASLYELPFILRRGGGASAAIVEGNATQLAQSGTVDVGWSSSELIEVTLSSLYQGTKLNYSVTVNSTSGVNDVFVGLKNV